MSYKAIVAGASGLIGNTLLNRLLDAPEYNEVLVLVRKEIPLAHSKLVQLIINFDELADHAAVISGHALFCCLGTTNAKTPDKQEYIKIDHDYPVQLAKFAKLNSVDQFHLVSSIGANPASRTFYTRLKGETERDVEAVGLKTLHIYQPSFLTGKRKENRLLERLVSRLMKVIDPLLAGSRKKYRSIPAVTVAAAMYKLSLQNESGTFIHPSDKIPTI